MTKNHRLNSISLGAEIGIHVIIGLFSVCCIIPFLFVAALTACGQSETPQKAAVSEVSIPTVEELAANPVVRKNYLGRDFELKKKSRPKASGVC